MHCAIEIFSKSHSLMTSALCYTFLLLQKSIKKRARKKDTPLFPDGFLIKLLYYCKLKFSSLISNFNHHKPTRKVKQSKP